MYDMSCNDSRYSYVVILSTLMEPYVVDYCLLETQWMGYPS